jgi:hypothetical protein
VTLTIFAPIRVISAEGIKNHICILDYFKHNTLHIELENIQDFIWFGLSLIFFLIEGKLFERVG